MTQAITEDGQSYQKHYIQFTREIATRAGNVTNKDEDFVNVFFELVSNREAQDQRSFVMKRTGTEQYITSQVANQVRGMFYWEDQYRFYYAADRHIYIWDFTTSTLTTLTNAFTTTSGDVGFTEYLYDNNTTVIIATDGATLNRIDSSNAITACTDPDMPLHLPCPVFLDGYLLVVKQGSADIYNSDLNDPMSWTPGDFISAEMSPDHVVKLSKINNYVVAFGLESIEYFWDAGNATGSPLQRNDTPIKINHFLGGLSQFGNDLYYVGKSSGGQPSVFCLRDFKIQELGTPSIMRYLNLVTENYLYWKTAVITVQGHNCLLVSAGTRSYVYDIDNKLWTRWSYKQQEDFPINFAIRITTQVYSYTLFSLKGNDSTIFKFNETLAQDSGVNYTCTLITEQADFDTLNRKTMSRFVLKADRTPSNSNISIYWTDDDFQTWNGPKTINMNQDLQSTYILGSFRQRAFKLVYTDQYILRLQYIEVDINKGIS